jgi:signal transduction histidine kinase
VSSGSDAESTRGRAETALRERYDAEIAELMYRRLRLASLLLGVFMGAATTADAIGEVASWGAALSCFAAELAICFVALRASARRPIAPRRRSIAAAMIVGSALILTIYNVLIGERPESGAVALVSLLTGAAVLMPWGGRVHAAVCALIAPMFFATTWSGATPMQLSGMVLAVATGCSTSLLAAFHLERYRRDASTRAELLQQSSARNREEADISAALVRIGAELSVRIEAGDVLDQVNGFAVEVLGCDWSSIFIVDEAANALRAQSSVGTPPEIVAELEEIDFSLDSFPIPESVRRGGAFEVADTATSTFVPAPVLQHFGITSVLFAGILRGTDLTGVLAVGYRGRRDAFSSRQRRLAIGIANATAIALENQRLVERLKAANQLKSEFVSTMSHELRTPLNTVIGFAELLDAADFGPVTDEQRDALQRIRRSAFSLRDLVTATLDLGRLEAGRDAIVIDRIDVGDLLDAVCEDLVGMLKPGVVALDWRRDPDAPIVYSDREKLTTILRNLLGNAIKFTPRGRIEVTYEAAPDALMLVVRDTGVGIEPQHLATIFEMFRQVDSSNSRRFGGVGLGLHIVKRLAERLGGSIEVQSKPGSGSAFHVTIPVRFEQRAQAG